ncbi:MAG: McrC family protein [Sandaracinaceae bacterium]|nr:McrC family protein [Sandaracinaceae bacterium]
MREQGRQEPLAIIDTKWKVPTDGRPSDADLKQMFAYNELFRGTRAVLLYPSDREPRAGVVGEFRGKGTTCETLFVPLFARGAALDEPLRFLRAQLFESGLRGPVDSVAPD